MGLEEISVRLGSGKMEKQRVPHCTFCAGLDSLEPRATFSTVQTEPSIIQLTKAALPRACELCFVVLTLAAVSPRLYLLHFGEI